MTIRQTLLALIIVLMLGAVQHRPGQETNGAESAVELTSRETLQIDTCLQALRVGCCGSESLYGAERQLATQLRQDPDSRVAPIVRALHRQFQEEIASHNLSVALYWLDDRSYPEPARMCLQGILEMYPRYSRTDEVLFQLARIEASLGNNALATGYLKQVLDTAGRSPRDVEARRLIKELTAAKN